MTFSLQIRKTYKKAKQNGVRDGLGVGCVHVCGKSLMSLHDNVRICD